MGNPVVNAVPEDFVVREVVALPQRLPADPGHTCLTLRKKGFTTLEAMDLLARHLALPADAVSAAALKDAEGVTEQTLSVAAEVPSALLGTFNRRWTPGTGRWLALNRSGTAARRLRGGELLGDAFLLTLRGLEADEADRLRSLPRGTAPVLFANYYDTRRFGAADGPKITHLIGQALLDGDPDLALALLRTSESPEGDLALRHTGGAEEFFAGLDQRATARYRTAHSAYLWNHRLGRLLEHHGPDDVLRTEREGLGYTYPTTTRPLLGLLAELPELEYDEWRWSDGTPRRTAARRPTVLQTVVTVRGVEPDDMFAGLWKCEVSFMLPEGSYATTAVSQFLLQLAYAQRPLGGAS